MSFDLNFGRADSVAPSLQELKAYFAQFPFFKLNEADDGGAQFWYENSVTGVYCDFSYSPSDTDEELGSLAASGLSFNLNYIRPSFFAYEAMPLVQRFCEYFDLLAEDVQEEVIHTGNANQLIESWKMHNERAVKAFSQQNDAEMRYLPEERATHWWRYMSIKDEIQSRFGEDVFVPTLMILEGPDRQIFTIIVWTKAIPQFFPVCDYLLLQRDKKRLFGTKEESGLVPFSDVMATIRPYLDEYSYAGLSLTYLRPDKAAHITSAFQQFILMPLDPSQHTPVSADGFHDVEFSNERL